MSSSSTREPQGARRPGAPGRWCAHYSNAPEAALALAAQRWFHNRKDLIGGHSPFTRTSFFQFVGPHDTGKPRENVTMLAGLGVNTRLVGADEIKSLAPQLWVGAAEFAAYEPDSGYTDPAATVAGLVAAARHGGATLRERATVTALRVLGGA